MKTRRFLAGLVFGVVIAGALAVGYFPVITDSETFLLGFFAGLFCLTALYFVLSFWRQSGSLQAKHRNLSDAGTLDKASGRSLVVSVWLPLLILLSGLTSFIVIRQDQWNREREKGDRVRQVQEAERIEAIRISGMGALLNNILNQVDAELRQNPDSSLSSETIDRIAALSHSYIPYTSFEGDSLVEVKLSPERGQLLMALTKMPIDTASMRGILRKTTFAFADLRGADLGGAFLRGADLQNASLRNAILDSVDLREANLHSANLWGAEMSYINMSGCDLRQSNLQWAVLDQANLSMVNLNGASLASAKLRGANLTKSEFKSGDLSNGILIGSCLFGVEFQRTKMDRTQFNDADLREANVSWIELSEVDFTGARLNGLIVSYEDWMERLESWFVISADTIGNHYKVIDQSPEIEHHYQLVRIAGVGEVNTQPDSCF